MHPSQVPSTRRWIGPALFLGLFLAVFLALATRGLGPGIPSPLVVGPVAALAGLVQGGLMPLAYLLAGVGLGRPVLRALGITSHTARPILALQAVAGIAAMLWVSHLMGTLGWLSWTPAGHTRATVLAWLPVALGLVLLTHQVVKGPLRPENWPVVPVGLSLFAPALAITFLAAASPVGWLWASEFGGYDAMSYHQQLPKEWLSSAPAGVGRLWPVTHNVYSALPSYFEGAFLHLGAMSPDSAAMGSGPTTSGGEKLVGGEGSWVLACQMLSAFSVVLLASVLVQWCRRLVAPAPLTPAAGSGREPHALLIALAAGACAAALPWTVVVGSLAYNEPMMLALFAGAMLCAGLPSREDGGARPLQRALLVGLLTGCACSVKPTAMLLCVPAAGLVLVASPGERIGTRQRVLMLLAASAGGLLMLAPWLIRNQLALGNPVFPFAAGLFGSAHWRPEQLATYLHNHAPEGSVVSRLGLLFSSTRGLAHDQWSLLPLAALAAALLALFSRATRRWAVLLLLGLIAQAAAWLFFTHNQSRFLLPMLVPMVGLIALGARAFAALLQSPGAATRRAAGALVVLCLIPAALTIEAAVLFLSQNAGAPNARLVGGPGILSGLGLAQALSAAGDADRREFAQSRLGAPALVNLAIHPGAADLADALGLAPPRTGPTAPSAARPLGAVYLLGDGAPLYYADAQGGPASPVLYHTAWDSSPLGDAIRQNPAVAGRVDPRDWVRLLRSPTPTRPGIEFLLVNFRELERLCAKDRYFDADVTPDTVRALLRPESGVVPVRLWPEEGRGLYRLVDPDGEDPSAR